MPYTSQAYLTYIQIVSQTYLRHISDISQEYLRHISGLSQTCLIHISTLSQVYLSHISGIFKAFLRSITGKYQVHLRLISDIALPSWYLSLRKQINNWQGRSTVAQIISWPKQGSKMKMIISQNRVRETIFTRPESESSNLHSTSYRKFSTNWRKEVWNVN